MIACFACEVIVLKAALHIKGNMVNKKMVQMLI